MRGGRGPRSRGIRLPPSLPAQPAACSAAAWADRCRKWGCAASGRIPRGINHGRGRQRGPVLCAPSRPWRLCSGCPWVSVFRVWGTSGHTTVKKGPRTEAPSLPTPEFPRPPGPPTVPLGPRFLGSPPTAVKAHVPWVTVTPPSLKGNFTGGARTGHPPAGRLGPGLLSCLRCPLKRQRQARGLGGGITPSGFH